MAMVSLLRWNDWTPESKHGGFPVVGTQKALRMQWEVRPGLGHRFLRQATHIICTV